MLSDSFFRHFIRLSAICYRKGCTDASWVGNDAMFESYVKSVRLPNSYGTYNSRKMPWRQWAHTLSLWLCLKGDLVDMLMTMPSNSCSQSAYLRIFQEMYICGVSDYFSTKCAYSHRTFVGINKMFFLNNKGEYKPASSKNIIGKVVECIYERMKSDEDISEVGGVHSGIMSRSTYENIIRELWIARTGKNKWYE